MSEFYEGYWNSDAIAHYGIKGQKHGVRNYQNEDGSLTAAGRDRYGVGKFERKINRINEKYNAKINKQKEALSQLVSASKTQKNNPYNKDVLDAATFGTKRNVRKLTDKRNAKIKAVKEKKAAKAAKIKAKFMEKINKQKVALKDIEAESKKYKGSGTWDEVFTRDLTRATKERIGELNIAMKKKLAAI